MVLVVEIDQPDVGNRDYICQDGWGGLGSKGLAVAAEDLRHGGCGTGHSRRSIGRRGGSRPGPREQVEGLAGGDLVEKGLRDLSEGRKTAEAQPRSRSMKR